MKDLHYIALYEIYDDLEMNDKIIIAEVNPDLNDFLIDDLINYICNSVLRMIDLIRSIEKPIKYWPSGTINMYRFGAPHSADYCGLPENVYRSNRRKNVNIHS